MPRIYCVRTNWTANWNFNLLNVYHWCIYMSSVSLSENNIAFVVRVRGRNPIKIVAKWEWTWAFICRNFNVAMAPHVLCGAIPDIPVDEVKQFCTDLFIFFPVLSISGEERLTIFTFLSRVNRILGEKGSKRNQQNPKRRPSCLQNKNCRNCSCCYNSDYK